MEEHPQQSESAAQGSEWLLSPDLPQATRLQISSVIEAEQLTPDVMQLLGSAMAEMQKAATAASAIPKDGCGRLRSCGSFRGGCPNLNHCGTYAPPGTPTI